MGDRTHEFDTQQSARESENSEQLLADDEFYRALASGTRRRILATLSAGTERTVEDLTAMLVGWNATRDETVGTPDQHQQTLIELEHTHLPMLASANLIEYDRETGTVVGQQLADPVRELLEQSIAAEP